MGEAVAMAVVCTLLSSFEMRPVAGAQYRIVDRFVSTPDTCRVRLSPRGRGTWVERRGDRHVHGS